MKHSIVPLKTLAALSIMLGGLGSARANLILNGSFETPIVPNGGFTNFYVGSSALTDWKVTGPLTTDNVSLVSGPSSSNGVIFNAQDGNQWLDLTGNGSNSTEGVSQDVTTTVGDRYQISYFVGNTTGGGGVFGTTSTVDVSLNGLVTFTDTNSNVSPSSLNWEQFTHTFIAGTTTTTVAFQNADPANDNTNGLDNVVLLDLGPATSTPEPSTLVLLSQVGAALLGLAWRGRRKLRTAAV